MAVPALSFFGIAHWHTHVQIGRRLAGDVLIAWRALGLREQLRLRWTLRRGRAVADAGMAELATHVAVAERALFDKPRAPLIGFGLGLAIAAEGVWVAIGGQYPPAFMLLLLA